jgi:hypothetical protein
MRRVATLVVALAGTLVCAALLVREVALAANRTVVWSAPHWWHDLLTAPTGLVLLSGVVAALLGIGCLWLALRMLGGGEPDEGAGIELGAEQTSVVVKAEALEHLLAQRLVDELAEVGDARVRVARRDQRLATRTSLSLTATDVRRTHARARAVIERELRAATGLDAGELTVEVDELLVGRGGGT